MQDLNGREYAKLSELKAGDLIELDSEFTCMKGVARICDEQGGLYICCSHGKHFLDGEVYDNYDDSLIGIYKV